MYISNEKLIKEFFAGLNIDDVNVILEKLLILKDLVRKFKFYLKEDDILTLLKNQDEDLWNLAILLKKLNKLDIQNIQSLIRLLKLYYPEYKKYFVVEANQKIYDQIVFYLKDRFQNVDINYKQSDLIWAKVKGEWWYFGKWLDKDLSKLLDI